ncbi:MULTISPECIES: LysR substrate-binding domain-containing protein [Serratia]|uniref:LysR substrate-binding domain-containing protein n=1 Tax=Serratia TaxID=613 RepID=UPI000862DFFE|nr:MULTISPECIES: LysR substrate-binding domain-containing protein [Serratia]EIY8595556.1 LysR family transcriptional regulator [Serratia marcescens]EIY8857392.1 LysR family transcriptional regulator [Serratia marcescens]EIY8864863.1 LysR family transcriptional regulator [Serratia marcescens]EIY9016881.1 LysR family transcriptional regulator [Serratia marcescens]ELY3098582.1 LysR family transcriptional regulator [Serratia marcescens]
MTLTGQLPPLNALRAFAISGRKESFRAAADEMCVTPGAVAQQVRALEQHLGITLFHRLPRGLALTPSGAAYLRDVTRAFDILTESTSKLLAQPNTVTISVTPTFAAKLLIPRLAEFHAELPEIELRTVATEALSDFERDQVDIAIRLTHMPFSSELETTLLFNQELVVVASPHLVRGLTLPLNVMQLQTLPLLHDMQNYWPFFLQSEEKQPGSAFNLTALALDAALAGQGVAVACRAFVNADIDAGRLVQVMDITKTLASSYFLVCKRAAAQRQIVRSVWEWCVKRLSLPFQ